MSRTPVALWLVAVLAWALSTGRVNGQVSTEAAERLPLETRLDLFLYIEEDEVRFEALLPLHVLEIFLPVPREEPDLLTPAEQSAVGENVAALLAAHVGLRIDGVEVQAASERVMFFDRDLMDIVGEGDPLAIDSADCLVGVIFRYPTLGAPSAVDAEWALFHPVLPTARCLLFPFGESRRVMLSESQPRASWRSASRPAPRPLEPVRASEAPRGLFSRRPALTGQEAREVTELLLRNVYRAFHYRDEERIYDALAHSLAGPLLGDVYLAIRRGLEVEAEGGAIVRIDRVGLHSFDPVRLGADVFEGQVAWQVAGRIEHWGHVHERENLYEGRLMAAIRDGQWRITALEVQGSRRLGARVVRREIPEEQSAPER